MKAQQAVNAYDAKTHFSQLLQAVAGGESFVINRHGRPVARLLPPGPVEAVCEDIDGLLGEFRDLRDHLGAPVDIRAMIEEGRRL